MLQWVQNRSLGNAKPCNLDCAHCGQNDIVLEKNKTQEKSQESSKDEIQRFQELRREFYGLNKPVELTVGDLFSEKNLTQEDKDKALDRLLSNRRQGLTVGDLQGLPISGSRAKTEAPSEPAQSPIGDLPSSAVPVTVGEGILNKAEPHQELMTIEHLKEQSAAYILGLEEIARREAAERANRVDRDVKETFRREGRG